MKKLHRSNYQIRLNQGNIFLLNLVWPRGGSKRPAVVFIGAKRGGLTSSSVNCGNQGKMASKMAFKVASCLAASSELNSFELF